MKIIIEKNESIVEIETGEGQSKRWNLRPDQAALHLPQFSDTKLPASERMTRGEQNAIRDAAEEFRKQRES